MKHNSNSPDCPYCVRLMTLIGITDKMSLGTEQWIARPVPGIFVSVEGEVSRFAIAAYSNPDATGMPNPLVYGIPLTFYRSQPEADAEIRVCLNRESAVPLAGALYWDADELVYDMPEDEDRFWGPIEKRLRSSSPTGDSKCQEVTVVSHTEGDRRTLEGISYRASLCAYVTWWSQSKEKLQDAICR